MLLVAIGRAQPASAQTAVVTHDVNLRADPSTRRAPIGLLHAGDEVAILAQRATAGFLHVRTSDGQEGWVWARNVRVPTPPTSSTAPARPAPGAPVRGSAGQAGCGDGLWAHVYSPSRLSVLHACMTVTGVVVDATANQPVRQPDGVRHEPDGDTHGWLKVDPAFTSLLAPANISHEKGNLIFEIVCHFPITQADAKPACVAYKDTTVIPPVGSHVAITGSVVRDTLHGWNEIHPVSSIKVQ